MTARADLTTLLTYSLPGTVKVIPYARNIDPPTKPTVMIRFDEYRPSPAAMGLHDFQYALILIASKDAPGPADDELELLLLQVVAAIEAVGPGTVADLGITWQPPARRGVYRGSRPSIQINVTVTANKEE